jgi:hypothetical protein
LSQGGSEEKAMDMAMENDSVADFLVAKNNIWFTYDPKYNPAKKEFTTLFWLMLASPPTCSILLNFIFHCSLPNSCLVDFIDNIFGVYSVVVMS